MKAPIIITARIEEADLLPFDALRSRHFPAKRNFLRAHLTMFHKLPSEDLENIQKHVFNSAARRKHILAKVSAVRHLGAGTAFTITSPDLVEIRSSLRAQLLPSLGPQDLQTWQPHITVQNGVSHTQADVLFEMLSEDFVPCEIRIIGIDLWQYLEGPWALLDSCLFSART